MTPSLLPALSWSPGRILQHKLEFSLSGLKVENNSEDPLHTPTKQHKDGRQRTWQCHSRSSQVSIRFLTCQSARLHWSRVSDLRKCKVLERSGEAFKERVGLGERVIWTMLQTGGAMQAKGEDQDILPVQASLILVPESSGRKLGFPEPDPSFSCDLCCPVL